MRIDPTTDILGVIDVQPTFMPGGELPVADGDTVIAPINRLLRTVFRHAFATQDWHPPRHISFASTHDAASFSTITLGYGPQILWPDHALQGSPNAALHPDLVQDRIEVVVRKGFHPEIDSYSAFFENDHATPTGLAGWLRERGIRRIFFAGLATDYCVAWSARDAVAQGFTCFVVEDACRGIGLPEPDGGTTIDTARRGLTAVGVGFLSADELSD